jgi:hypothetical protein
MAREEIILNHCSENQLLGVSEPTVCALDLYIGGNCLYKLLDLGLCTQCK